MWKPWFSRSRDPFDFIFRSAPCQRITPLATRSHSIEGLTSTDGAEYFDRNVPPSTLRLLSESVSYFKRPFNTLRMLTYRSESLFSTKTDCAIIMTSFDTLNSPIQRETELPLTRTPAASSDASSESLLFPAMSPFRSGTEHTP